MQVQPLTNFGNQDADQSLGFPGQPAAAGHGVYVGGGQVHPQAVPHPVAMGFEFGAEHNAVIGRTASYMRAFAVLSIIFGVLQVLASLAALAVSPAALGQTAAGAVAVTVGIVFLRGSARLLAVVKTQGDDLAHMMAALTALGSAFLVQVVAVTIAFFVGAVAAGLVSAGLI